MDLASTLIDMAPASSLVYGQLIDVSSLGGLLGHRITKRAEPIELPQVVTGFYLLVGVAAASRDSIEDFMIDSDVIANIYHHSMQQILEFRCLYGWYHSNR